MADVYGPGAVLVALSDLARTTGVAERYLTGEYTSPPGNGLSFSVWVNNFGTAPEGSGLDATAKMMQMQARVQMPMSTEPRNRIDVKLLDAEDKIFSAWNASFTLGGLVRNLDLLGQDGEVPGWQHGYVSYGPGENKFYRIADMTLRAVLTDEWTQGA